MGEALTYIGPSPGFVCTLKHLADQVSLQFVSVFLLFFVFLQKPALKNI